MVFMVTFFRSIPTVLELGLTFLLNKSNTDAVSLGSRNDMMEVKLKQAG